MWKYIVTLTKLYLNDRKKPYVVVHLTYGASLFKFAQKQLKFARDLDQKSPEG